MSDLSKDTQLASNESKELNAGLAVCYRLLELESTAGLVYTKQPACGNSIKGGCGGDRSTLVLRTGSLVLRHGPPSPTRAGPGAGLFSVTPSHCPEEGTAQC